MFQEPFSLYLVSFHRLIASIIVSLIYVIAYFLSAQVANIDLYLLGFGTNL